MFEWHHILYFDLILWAPVELESFVGVIAPPTEVAFPPRYRHFYTTSATEAAAFEVFGVMGVGVHTLHELLYLYFLFFVVLLEHSEGTDPSFLDDLVIAGELPGDVLGVIAGSKVVVQVHGAVANVLFLHHVFAVELDRKEGRVEVELTDSLYVDYVDGAFRKLVSYF
jgi:hypothetical protein